MRLRSVVVLLGTFASLACARATSGAQLPAERGPAIVEVSEQGVTLEVLDWGGSGPPIVFLAGGGNSTPHDFDDFAPRFTNNHRVIGITRRGNGGSSAQRPRGFDDYVDDIVAVLDAFHFDRVAIVGHSFAGLEMARFGEKYGRRCAALVYMDAAYDYTDPALEKIFESNRPPAAPSMTSSDSASIDAVRDWYGRTQRFRPPVSALRASRLWGNDGRLIGQKPSPADSWNIPIPTPQWERVTCPSLGVYAMPAPYETYLRYWSSLDSLQQARAKDYYAAFAPWTKKNRDAFGRVARNRVVEFPSASHYFFMEQPEEAARVIDVFLNNLE